MSFARLFHRIQEQFRVEDPATRQEQMARTIRVATAGLLLDVAHADAEFSDAERTKLVEHLTRQFDLDAETSKELLAAAEEARSQTIDHFAFANLLRLNIPLDDRLGICRTMWSIVYADGSLNQHEEYLVRKISELLGIEHHRMIEQKVAVRRQLGLSE